jgi:eukaryotic-like serine/threonine-protein kinase
VSAELPGGGTVGRYRILRTLGSGAMGVVYLAQDPQIERLLAIKTVRIGADEPAEIADRRERLLREAKTAGRLIHPHVVTLFDAGEQNGTLYLAFEYVEGSNLSERLAGPRPLALSEALRIARETAEGLTFAHRQGIVHRDVKPANLLLATDGTVKISDFGIAKVLGQATELTMTGTVIGSPHYLSPEQVRGEELDGRSDLFSLGVVLYELLGDRRPFDGDTLTTLLYQILHQEPPPMVLRPGVPAELTGLLSGLLAKDREHRFADAGRVVAAIEALETGLPEDLLARPAVLAGSAGQVEPTRLLPITGMQPVAPVERPAAPEVPPPPPPAPAVASRAGATRWVVPVVALLALAGATLAAYLLVSRLFDRGPAEVTEEPVVTARIADGSEPGTPSEPPAEPDDGAGGDPLPATNPPRPASDPSSTSQPVSEPAATAGERPAPAPPPAAAAPALDRAEPERRPAPEPEPEPRVAASLPTRPAERRAARREAVRDAIESRVEELTPDQTIESGLAVVFDVRPTDSFLLLDGTVIGRASEYGSGSPYVLPGEGEYRLKVRSPGMEDQRILLRASAGGPARTTVSARLAPAAASELALGDLPLVRVQNAIAFEVTPAAARVEVDGRPVGRADQYPGRFGRPATWLKLQPGRHRVSLSAPGHARRDYAVDVSDGAPEAREKIRVTLPLATGDGP